MKIANAGVDNHPLPLPLTSRDSSDTEMESTD